MTSIIGLDLSKRSAGFAGWASDLARPVLLSQALGSDWTEHGMMFAKLHGVINDLARTIGGVDVIYCEEPLQPQAMAGHTTFDTLFITYGLAAHAASYAAAKRIRFHMVNQTNWRRHYIGKMARGTKSKQFKDYSRERASQLGITVMNDDEADALGVLDYGCDREGVIPPWRANEVLRPPLGATA